MILNLTPHTPSPEQAAQGLVDLPREQRVRLGNLLRFVEHPGREELAGRAQALARLAAGAQQALVGGPLFLLPALEQALRAVRCRPLYAFSRRQGWERMRPDGTVEKRLVFTHQCFIPGMALSMPALQHRQGPDRRLNLTRHTTTPQQRAQGVTDVSPALRLRLAMLLTFERPPGSRQILARAVAVAKLARDCQAAEAMIGGAPWLMAPLAAILAKEGISPVLAFSCLSAEAGFALRLFHHQGLVPLAARARSVRKTLK